MSLAQPENAHCRTVISKFGGTIRLGNAVSIPPQPWHSRAPPEPDDSFLGRHQPHMTVVNSAIPGYRGHRPHAPQWGMHQRRVDHEAPLLSAWARAQIAVAAKHAGEQSGHPHVYSTDAPHAPDHFALNVGVRPKAWQ